MRKPFFLFIFLLFSVFCFSQKTNRIITAGSAITETVCALGDCAKIVASDRTSLHPASIQSLPSIGYRSGIHSEGIISLHPGLFIAEKDYVEDAVLSQIQSAGINTIIIERTYNLEGTRDLVRKIAVALDKSAEGEKLIAKIEDQLTETASLVKKSGIRPRVLCVYNRGAGAVDVAGTKTFSAILPYVGAESAISGVDGYKPMNTEALIASNPDYLLMFESGVESLGGIEGVLKIAGVSQTTAGKKRQIIAMEGIKLSNFGPRLGEAVKELALLLHRDSKSN